MGNGYHLHSYKKYRVEIWQENDLKIGYGNPWRCVFKSYVLRELDFHSDLGSQYTSEAYEAKLKELNIHHSFSLSAGKIAHTTTLVLNRSTHQLRKKKCVCQKHMKVLKSLI